MHALWQDVRYGVRMLAKNPGFSLAVMVMLALGIGANTALFSAVKTVLLNSLPYKNPDMSGQFSVFGFWFRFLQGISKTHLAPIGC